MKIYFVAILFFISQGLFSQNTFSDSTRKIPFDTNKIKDAVLLSKTSEIFSYDSLYIWNDKRSLSEIMDERPGYFIYDFGLGGKNDINYNGRYSRETGIFRDGIQINDNFFQSFDIQNISVNEIDKIEEVSDVSSFFYGINTFAKSINVITKDVFQPKPFSQLRFSQDRFGSLYADVFFSQPFSRKANVQLGLTKHSIDGRYPNSSFNIWRGRSRVNLFFSPKLNAKLNFYLDNFDRDLNDGLVYSPFEDSLTNPGFATVVNPAASEHLENYYYDVTMTARLLKNKNSLSKLKIYSNSSLRHLFNPDSVHTLENYPASYNHSLLYGLDLQQNISIAYSRNFNSDILFGGNVYLNLFDGNLFNKFEENYYSLKVKYDLNYKNLYASALLRNDYIQNTNYLNAGIESKFKVINNRKFMVELNGGINQTQYILFNDAYVVLVGQKNIYEIPRKFYQGGVKVKYKNFTLFGEFSGGYDTVYKSAYGVNSNFIWNSKYSDISVSYSYFSEQLFPTYYIKSDLAYKNILFRGKLKLKTGFNIKYYNIKNITNQYQTWYSWSYSNDAFPRQNQFIADFYIGARIGRANINITVANIFNSLVYNAYVFPLDDRGGFVNAISRFTIVWDFIN
ncbi:MAG: TonB-dependent receptor plug domain-containing protein [Bacteroidota bacterium]|nr:TonB-dependent receptor plug domain-containing protein [Bacteroidota bacterium]